MSQVDSATATQMHQQDLRPYSLFTLPQENNIIFRLSILADEAIPLYDVAKNTKVFDVTGIESGIAALDVLEHEDIPVHNLSENPPKQLRLLFASPATYKHAGMRSNIFALAPLLRSVAEKLRLFEDVDICTEEIETLCDTVSFPEYALESKAYYVKQGNAVPGFVGEMILRFNGNNEQNAKLALLLRYAQYSGLGGKTALGMGGILIDERTD